MSICSQRLLVRFACLSVAVGCFGVAEDAPAASTSGYVRFQISPGFTTYALVWEDRLFLADTPEGLAAVEPVKAVEADRADPQLSETWAHYRFPEAALAAPADKLPAGVTQVRVALSHNTARYWDPRSGRGEFSYLHGSLGWCRKDKHGALWGWWWNAGTETGKRPRTAPVIELPEPGPLTLAVSTQKAEGGAIGIGVRLKLGKTALHDVTKDGRTLQARVQVLDAAGEVVKSERGSLAKFGFT